MIGGLVMILDTGDSVGDPGVGEELGTFLHIMPYVGIKGFLSNIRNDNQSQLPSTTLHDAHHDVLILFLPEPGFIGFSHSMQQIIGQPLPHGYPDLHQHPPGSHMADSEISPKLRPRQTSRGVDPVNDRTKSVGQRDFGLIENGSVKLGEGFMTVLTTESSYPSAVCVVYLRASDDATLGTAFPISSGHFSYYLNSGTWMTY